MCCRYFPRDVLVGPRSLSHPEQGAQAGPREILEPISGGLITEAMAECCRNSLEGLVLVKGSQLRLQGLSS